MLLVWHLCSVQNVLKFADDTKIFRQVRDVQDSISMQADLDQLVEWADKWQMQFNVSQVQGYACRPEKSKCEVSRVRAMLLMSVVYIFFCLLLGLLFCRSRYILRRPCRHCRPVISAADVGWPALGHFTKLLGSRDGCGVSH